MVHSQETHNFEHIIGLNLEAILTLFSWAAVLSGYLPVMAVMESTIKGSPSWGFQDKRLAGGLLLASSA